MNRNNKTRVRALAWPFLEIQLMESKKIQRRYWISTSSPAHIAEIYGEEITAREKEFDDFLTGLGFSWKKDDRLYKTWGEEDALRIKKMVEGKGSELLDREQIVNVSIQPQCPACGKLARFSASCCEKCGSELLEAELL